MKALICKNGIIHFSGKCNCWKKPEPKQPQVRYVLSDELKALGPGTYHVQVRKSGSQLELIPADKH